MKEILDIFSDIAQILTAIFAGLFYIRYALLRRKKKVALEKYLLAELSGTRGASRSVVHLSAALGLPESEVLEIAFASNKIRATTSPDPETGRATHIWLKYSE